MLSFLEKAKKISIIIGIKAVSKFLEEFVAELNISKYGE
ncbi:hypothetical protein E34_1218 [Lactococcus lactis subsp. lactis]|jgi:hypothetical protein|nr:hypothetical protein E34_1218 [Lactococcus lactis subsp. lactis]